VRLFVQQDGQPIHNSTRCHLPGGLVNGEERATAGSVIGKRTF
jgi:hypothetical protein